MKTACGVGWRGTMPQVFIQFRKVLHFARRWIFITKSYPSQYASKANKVGNGTDTMETWKQALLIVPASVSVVWIEVISYFVTCACTCDGLGSCYERNYCMV